MSGKLDMHLLLYTTRDISKSITKVNCFLLNMQNWQLLSYSHIKHVRHIPSYSHYDRLTVLKFSSITKYFFVTVASFLSTYFRNKVKSSFGQAWHPYIVCCVVSVKSIGGNKFHEFRFHRWTIIMAVTERLWPWMTMMHLFLTLPLQHLDSDHRLPLSELWRLRCCAYNSS